MESAEKESCERNERKPSFFKELYGFLAICLLGWMFAMLVIPPRANKYWKMLSLESKLTARNAALQKQADILESRTTSMDTDPFYKEAEIRKILGVKKNSEEYLQPDTISSDKEERPAP